MIQDSTWPGPWRQEFGATIDAMGAPEPISHPRAHAGELAYWVRFDEPQLDAGGMGPYRKALIWCRYLRAEPDTEQPAAARAAERGSGAREEAPLLREKYPDLSRELISLLEAEGETDLAICARDLRIVALCSCKDDFCQSFYTAPPPDGTYGPGHRNLPLNRRQGMLILDVVNNQIMFVELLHYPPLGETRAM